jgi:hypothetical protein
MAIKKKVLSKPVPDSKAVTRTILARVADWMERGATYEQLTGERLAQRKTADEQAALAEGLQNAVNYVRLGTR